MILQSCTSSLVACNIYITSAASAALPSLLSRAQDHCRQLRLVQQQQQCNDENKESNTAAAAVVHAYADIPYDRSSFHLAGRSDCVAEVAISLIQNALNEIELKNNNNNDASNKLEARHPFVGLVDHVSVMSITSQEIRTTTPTTAAAASAARQIGSQIDQSNSNSIKIHYYGMACPNNTPLATVRRKTSFFNSGGAHDNNENQQQQLYEKGECTIGTPLEFVENYNIRLTPNVDFGTAKTLTQVLRGRNIATKGMGVSGVEALTLPYIRHAADHGGNVVYEVACNLLEPKIGSVEMIEVELEKWIQQQKQQLSKYDGDDTNDQYDRDYFVEEAYRVGTTEEQCLSVLKNADEDEYWMRYDQQVFSRFNEFLGYK
eukprot:scaffold9984_cov148-Skeletonema_dohrnii-CCMP3373.AAC.17